MLSIPIIEWDLVAEKMVPDGEPENMPSVLITHWLQEGDRIIRFCVFCFTPLAKWS